MIERRREKKIEERERESIKSQVKTLLGSKLVYTPYKLRYSTQTICSS